MHIGVLGISYKSAEIGIREFVAKACRFRIAENYPCVVLSTCNRSEIYFSGENLADAHSQLLQILREEIAIPFEHKLYSFFGFDCFMHLARVTAGLDSAIIAESEIQRQVKVAYEQTLSHCSLPSSMHYLFQKSLKLGKKIRSDFSLSQNQVSIPKILFQISQDIVREQVPVLFIGNSEINRKVIEYFQRKELKNLTLCTRNPGSARQIYEQDEIALLPWNNISCWQAYPIVICGSNAPHCLVDHPHDNLQTRLIFDLSMPRNVHPSLSRHPQLVLLNMEELTEMIIVQQQKNLQEIERAENVIVEGVQRYHFSYRQKTLVVA